ncbi:MAG: GNAT family N-acetyltransferase [Verrucomicrobia bacterium]|nr:GNAT family N-acetyltransferase [Verrucomicrobiota bacterium]
MTIRPAIPGDAPKVVPLILQAIGAIALVLTGTDDTEEAASVLRDFFGQEQNRVSYENTLVLEEDREVAGLVIFYDGADAHKLDAPLERAAARRSGRSDYQIPTEPEKSEFYLDTLSVSPGHQRKGYGGRLVEAACDRARCLGHPRIALLVEVDSPDTRRLYERFGFRADYTKRIARQDYVHMVRDL